MNKFIEMLKQNWKGGLIAVAITLLGLHYLWNGAGEVIVYMFFGNFGLMLSNNPVIITTFALGIPGVIAYSLGAFVESKLGRRKR